jgi:hypothetical protein
MKDTLILQNKKYISAKRAAVIFGYTSDYVGQLCRDGKLECTMVGRSWFLNEESLLAHRLSNSSSDVVQVAPLVEPILQKSEEVKENDSHESHNKKFDLALALIFLMFSVVFLGRNFLSFVSKTPEALVSSVLNGLVVTPSQYSFHQNEIIKQNLRNPFSDEVNISPDSSGTAGVITPVFKESQGEDFLYVMVPVKDTTKNEN